MTETKNLKYRREKKNLLVFLDFSFLSYAYSIPRIKNLQNICILDGFTMSQPEKIGTTRKNAKFMSSKLCVCNNFPPILPNKLILCFVSGIKPSVCVTFLSFFVPLNY